MIIRNKYLNISSRDILNETDLIKLKQWLLDIEENILCMDMAITQAKLKAYEEKVYSDQTWFNKITTACRLQKLLKIQLESHIFELENNRDLKLLKFLESKLGKQWQELINEFENEEKH